MHKDFRETGVWIQNSKFQQTFYVIDFQKDDP